MARSMLSFGMFSARAAMIAARSRGFIAGSGVPSLADTVISRASFENSLDLTASCRPLRCMMFLYCECPAMGLYPTAHTPARPHDRRARRSGGYAMMARLIGRLRGKIQDRKG